MRNPSVENNLPNVKDFKNRQTW